MTSFNEKIYKVCKKIPKGRVSSYSEVALALDTKAYRAVGQALKRNPDFPNTPCFRIVASDGGIGGFNGKTKGKEIKRKITLLRREGIKIKNNKIQDFEKVFFKLN